MYYILVLFKRKDFAANEYSLYYLPERYHSGHWLVRPSILFFSSKQFWVEQDSDGCPFLPSDLVFFFSFNVSVLKL